MTCNVFLLCCINKNKKSKRNSVYVIKKGYLCDGSFEY